MIAVVGLLVFAPSVRADVALPRVDDGEGVKVGKASKFHAGLAIPVGIDSNVFNETAAEQPRTAGYIYPTAWMGIGSRDVINGVMQTPPDRTNRIFDYNFGVIAGFRQYTARRVEVRSQPRFSAGALVRLALMPGRRFSVRLDEDFFRGASPGNYETRGNLFNFNRIDHKGALTFIGRPGGGRLSLSLGYVNTLLRFSEEDLNKANRVSHGAVHETKWRFLPKSSLVFHYDFAWNFYTDCCTSVGRGRNEDNYAHRLQGGYRGQVLKKLTLEAMAGWGFGFYRQDPNGPNFSSFIGTVGLGYYPTPRTNLYVAGFRDFNDALFGNFFVDTGVRAGVNHQFRWRMTAKLGAAVMGRVYHGLPQPGEESEDIAQYSGRGADQLQQRDTLVTLAAGIDQPLGRIFAVGLNYNLLLDATNFQVTYTNGAVDDLGYVKHVAWLLAAIRI